MQKPLLANFSGLQIEPRLFCGKYSVEMWEVGGCG